MTWGSTFPLFDILFPEKKKKNRTLNDISVLYKPSRQKLFRNISFVT